MPHPFRPLLGLALVALSAIAAAAFCVAQPLEAQPPAAQPSTAQPPQVGAAAPDFRLAMPDGTPVELSKLTPRGPVVLVVLRGFPGYQCPACNAQTGGLIAAADKFRAHGAQVVLVYPGQSAGLPGHADKFLAGKTLPDNVRLVLDPDYALTERYALRWDAPRETAYPSTFVIDVGGIVRFAKISRTHGGRTTADEILQALDAL